MKKIKLPRKRKKAMIKATDRAEYVVAQIIARVLIEDNGGSEKYNRKFPREFYPYRNKLLVKSWW